MSYWNAYTNEIGKNGATKPGFFVLYAPMRAKGKHVK